MKNQLVLFVLIFYTSFCLAQIETKVFELDLGSPTKNSLRVMDSTSKSKGLVIKTKQPLAFKLINANPYKYQYEINFESIDFFKDDLKNPFEKSMTEIESASQPDKPEVEKIKEELESSDQEQTKKRLSDIQKLKAENELLLMQKKIIEVEEKSVENIFNKEFHIASENSILNNNAKNLKEEQLKIMLEFDNQIKKINSSIKHNNELIEKGNVKLAQLKEQEEEEIKLRETTYKLNKKKEELLKNGIILELQIETELMQDLYFKLDNYLQTIAVEDYLDNTSFIKNRDTFSINYQRVIRNTNKLSQRASAIKDFATIYNEQLNYVKTIAEKVKELLSKMFTLKFDNYLHPIDFNGQNVDVIELTLKRYNKALSKQEKDYTYSIWVKGGLKIDVSGGVFLTSLVDRSYGITDVIVDENGTEETRQVIHEKNPGDYQYGFGSTINTSLRLGTSWVKPALSIGALFTNDQKFQILAGAGAILGKKERIVLQFGLSMGQVSKIIDRYKADEMTPYDISSDDAIPIKQKFEFGHFFGISYNFGKIKSQKKP